jgi:hypothetical protein
MKPHRSVWVARMWCHERTNTILRCFVNLEVSNCEDLVVGVVHELASCLRLSTEVTVRG